jgi:hypothetical protein
MPAPSIAPDQRDLADVVSTDSYRPTDPVWVFRGGYWHAGVVRAASPRAVTVSYQLRGAWGPGVVTVTAIYVLARADADPSLDRLSESQVG